MRGQGPPFGGVSRGLPSRAATFFGISIISSAWPSFLFNRSFSRWRRSSSSLRGSRVRLRPRLASWRPWRAPDWYCRRHWVRAEEYRPSRRRRAPSSPGFVHRCVSSTTPALYAAVNRRLRGWARTSASGAGESAARLLAPAFGSPPLRCGSPLSVANNLLFCFVSIPSSIILISLPSTLILSKELSHLF